MIEEQDGDLGTPFTQSELHSIAVYCQHTACPIPKAVSNCLLQESSTARLASVCLAAALIFSDFMIFGFGFWFLFESLGTADDSLLLTIAWFIKGMVFELFVVGFITVSSLAAASNCFSYKLAAAILAAVIVFGGLFAAVWIFITPMDTYGIRTEIIFTSEAFLNTIVATVVFTLLVR